MFLRYSYHLHNAHQRPLYAHLPQELQVEAEEVEAEEEEAEEVEAEEEAEEEVEEEEQIPKPHLTSDSAETPPKYSREKEKRQTASSPNSNAII